MPIDELLKIVSPPKRPVDKGAERKWKTIQRGLGLQLPSDLRDVAAHYGSGSFLNGFFTVYNPFGERYMELVNDEFYSLNEAKMRGMKFDVYPVSPGLFPWGNDENGNKFLWLTEGGDPNQWPVMVRRHGYDTLARFDSSLIEFLVKFFLNRLDSDYLQNEPFSKDQLIFMPQRVP